MHRCPELAHFDSLPIGGAVGGTLHRMDVAAREIRRPFRAVDPASFAQCDRERLYHCPRLETHLHTRRSGASQRAQPDAASSGRKPGSGGASPSKV